MLRLLKPILMIYQVFELIKGFKPLVDKNSTVLILGSMPSNKSIEMQEYYAHPQNRFWKIMANIYQTSLDCYEHKLCLLKRQRIALWDVIDSCERIGSLDANIKQVNANDLLVLLSQYQNIKKIICNGKKSGEILEKVYGDKIKIPYVILPSTSPANASYSLETLIMLYEEQLK